MPLPAQKVLSLSLPSFTYTCIVRHPFVRVEHPYSLWGQVELGEGQADGGLLPGLVDEVLAPPPRRVDARVGGRGELAAGLVVARVGLLGARLLVEEPVAICN